MRDMERFHSTTIDFGGKEVDLTERDRDELETMDELLTRNLDAEIDAQKARGGTQPSSLAQDFGKRQGRVSSEIQFRREMEQNEAVGSHRGTADIFRGPTTPTDIGRRSSGRFDRPDSNPDVDPQPIARDKSTGRFGLDPFDIGASLGGLGSTDEQFGGDFSNAADEATYGDSSSTTKADGGFLSSPPELTEGDDPFLVGNPGEFNSPYKSKDKDKYD